MGESARSLQRWGSAQGRRAVTVLLLVALERGGGGAAPKVSGPGAKGRGQDTAARWLAHNRPGLARARSCDVLLPQFVSARDRDRDWQRRRASETKTESKRDISESETFRLGKRQDVLRKSPWRARSQLPVSLWPLLLCHWAIPAPAVLGTHLCRVLPLAFRRGAWTRVTPERV